MVSHVKMTVWDDLPIHLQENIIKKSEELIVHDWLTDRVDYPLLSPRKRTDSECYWGRLWFSPPNDLLSHHIVLWNALWPSWQKNEIGLYEEAEKMEESPERLIDLFIRWDQLNIVIDDKLWKVKYTHIPFNFYE